MNCCVMNNSMNKKHTTRRAITASGILACLSGTAGATTIFTENFNGYAGNQNAVQVDTGLNVAFGGSVAGWSTSGAGVMHAVDLGASDWAIMFFQDNVITQSDGIGANALGASYEVTFDYGTGVYAQLSQKTEAVDSLLVEVLRGDNTVLRLAAGDRLERLPVELLRRAQERVWVRGIAAGERIVLEQSSLLSSGTAVAVAKVLSDGSEP